MRDIIFRGKRTDNGEWVYGDLRQYVNNPHGSDFYQIDTMSTSDNDFGNGHTVDIETVGQFTGLTDKNGNKIFEGDIIKFCKYAFDYQEEKDWDIEIGEIAYEDGCFVINEIYSSDGYNELSCVYSEIHYGEEYDKECIFEVIGNIYDNPELLGE